MAYYDYGNRFQGSYNMGYRPTYYGRDNYRPYHDLAPIAFREEPFYDNYRRDYRLGGIYNDRYEVRPVEEVFRRVQAPHSMDQGRYHHGMQLGKYRLDRYDHHGGQDHGHGDFLHHDQGNHQRHGNYHSSRKVVELYVPICCDKCERKLRKHLNYVEGVETITVDQTTKKVVVFGHVNPSYVLNRARQDKPASEFWHSRGPQRNFPL